MMELFSIFIFIFLLFATIYARLGNLIRVWIICVLLLFTSHLYDRKTFISNNTFFDHGFMHDIVISALFYIGFTGLIAVLFVRIAAYVFVKWRHRQGERTASSFIGSDYFGLRKSERNASFAYIAGALIGADIFLTLGFLLPPLHAGALAHFLVLGLAIASMRALNRVTAEAHRLAIEFKHAALGAAYVIGFCSLLGLFLPLAVISSANAVAGAAPYCIALPYGGSPVGSLSDLTFFGIGSKKINNHAYLYVQREKEIKGFHWSFREGQFKSGVFSGDTERNARINCDLSVKFSSVLPVFKW